jgi:hypothetical protein
VARYEPIPPPELGLAIRRLRPRPRRLAAIAATFSALLLAAPAGATVYHASPTGKSTDDCTTTPCDFATAWNKAVDTDEVVIAPGDYGSQTTPVFAQFQQHAVNVHGEAGKPRPRIYTSYDFGLSLTNASAKLSHVHIVELTGGANTALYMRDAHAEDVIAETVASGGSAACRLTGTAVLRDSVCWSRAQGPHAIGDFSTDFNNDNVTLRNVTAVALASGSAGLYVQSGSGVSHTFNVVNSILEGSPNGIATNTQSGGTVTVNTSYSNIVGLPAIDSSFGGTVNTSPTNVQAPAQFVDLSNGDYHQLPGSPTVNAGQDSLDNGPFDFDGQARNIGGRTDIGADEFVPTPPAVATGSATPHATSAGLAGTVNPKGVSGVKAYFAYGKTKSYGRRTAARTLAANSKAQKVSANLTGLSPRTTYHYRLFAGGPGGAAQGADRTFKTTAPFTGLALPKQQSVRVTGGIARIAVNCPSTAQGHCMGTLALTKGKAPNVVKLGQASFNVPKGKAKIAVDLNAKAKDLLAKGSVNAKAKARTKDGSGGAAKLSAGKVTLTSASAAPAR